MAEIGLFEALYTQRAIRSFKPDPVGDDLIVKMVEAATKAPSGGNSQPWAFIAVRDREKLDRFAAFARHGFDAMLQNALARQQPGDPPPFPRLTKMIETFERIPVIVVVCAELPPGVTDVSPLLSSVLPAVQNLLLAARGLGLGAALTSGWATPDMAEIKEMLGLPASLEPVAFVPVGWPDQERYGPTTRRPVDEVLHWDGWEPGKPNTAKLAHRMDANR